MTHDPSDYIDVVQWVEYGDPPQRYCYGAVLLGASQVDRCSHRHKQIERAMVCAKKLKRKLIKLKESHK